MKQSKSDFLDFLAHTLIPDLRADGRMEPAVDLRDCYQMGRDGRKDAKTAAYFRMVARDYKSSGAYEMAKDFARCARMVSPVRRRK